MTRGGVRPRLLIALSVLLLLVAATAADATQQRAAKWRARIQPGTGVYNPELKKYCTLGFLLKDPAGAIYGITDAQCGYDEGPPEGVSSYEPFYGARTWAPGKGPVAERNSHFNRRFGHYVAQVVNNNSYQSYVLNGGLPLNYAIVRVDPNVEYDGTVGVVGGPRPRPYTGNTSSPTVLTFVCIDTNFVDFDGVPTVYDDGVRQGVAPLGLGSPTFDIVSQNSLGGPACPGAPILDAEGQAVAVFGSRAYRLDAIIAAAQKQLHLSLRLVAAGETGTTKI